MPHTALSVLQPQLVREQRNEFRVGGLSLAVIHRVAEKGIDGVQVASVPCDLNGVADGTLHTGRGGVECCATVG